MRKINLGSADTTTPGWLNCDLLPGPNVDMVANAKYLYAQQKPDVLRASHLLEHVPPSETLYVLRTWYDTLNTGGSLIVGVPDFDYVVREYLTSPERYLCFWKSQFNSMLFKQLYGSFYAHRSESDNEHFRHLAVFNKSSLTELLEDVGFVDVERLRISDSEGNEGFDDAMLLPWSLNMKCRKPG